MELASLIGVKNPETISQWIRGHNEPKDWREIAKLLGLSESQYVAEPRTDTAAVVKHGSEIIVSPCPLIVRLEDLRS